MLLLRLPSARPCARVRLAQASQTLTALDVRPCTAESRDAPAPVIRISVPGDFACSFKWRPRGQNARKAPTSSSRRPARRCFYCSLPVWEQNCRAFARQYGIPKGIARDLRCTAEHLIARQDRGQDVEENIVAACRWCNLQRHQGGREALRPQEWRQEVRALIASGKWHPAARMGLFSIRSS